MAVLIKGMEMPKTCLHCPCMDDEYWLCRADAECGEPDINDRPSWCPLVEIPERSNSPDIDKLLEEAGME